MAIASLIVSLIGLPGIVCFGIVGLILGGVGFFLGRSSLNRIRASGGAVGGAGLAQAGWIIGVVAAALGALYFIYIVVVFAVAISSGTRNTTP
jgi:hypothetical protein